MATASTDDPGDDEPGDDEPEDDAGDDQGPDGYTCGHCRDPEPWPPRW